MNRLKIYLQPFLKITFIISFGLAWIITNGWAYIIAFMPFNFPEWLMWLARAYIGFLYLPWTPEKIITIPIAIWIHVRLFRDDTKTHIQLIEMKQQAQLDWKKIKDKFKKKCK